MTFNNVSPKDNLYKHNRKGLPYRALPTETKQNPSIPTRFLDPQTIHTHINMTEQGHESLPRGPSTRM